MKKTCAFPAIIAFVSALAGPLAAQNFSPVPALSFTKVFDGANPLPQILTIASTGSTVIRFNASETTSTGGSWLQISPSGNACCYTPEAITVSVNPVVTLAAGTYNGQITITDYTNSTNTMTVPVALIIAPAGGTFLDNLPGQLSFFLQTGSGGSVPYQVVQIRNGGTGTLSWSLTASTADGGNWLGANSVSGTAPSNVAISVAPQNLPGGGAAAGTYIGQLRFDTAGSSVTVPVTFTVGDNVFRQINPISFTKVFSGANPLPQILMVASTGSTAIRFNATAATATGGNWLQVSPSGNACCYTPETVTVTVNPVVTLAVGTYTGEITFTEYPDNNLAMTVPVTLTVAAAGSPVFDNVPGQLSFSLETGSGVNPPFQPAQIRNAGNGALTWIASKSTSDGGGWLTVSPQNGNAPSMIRVSITTSALPGAGLVAGTFVGQLRFDTAGSSVTIPVAVTVGESVFRQVNPIAFTKPFGGANPLPQIVTVASTGPDTIRFNAVAATGSGGAWLQISPSGNACCYTPEAVTVSVNPSVTLPAGTYTGEITFTEYSTNDISMTVPVTLVVSPAGSAFFDNVPGQLSFSIKTGSSVNPPSQPVQIRNGGTGSLTWSMTMSTSDGGNWLSVSPLNGAAPSNVVVSVTTSALPDGGLVAETFIGQVTFLSASSSVSIPIAVTVGDSVFSQVNPISFTRVFGGANPLPQIVTVASTGSDTIRFNAVAATATGGNWLQISPSGNACCYTPEAVTVSVNPSVTLPAGTYTGEITFTEYSTNDISMTVPVTLVISSPGAAVFDNVPGQLSFSVKTGASTNPPYQTVQIRNAGTGTLNWALTKSTSDGGAWLNVSVTSGTAPKLVAVSVTTSALPNGGLVAGTFTGQLTFWSAYSSVTIPIVVNVGDSVFSQVNPISFTMAAGGANPLPQVLTVASTGADVIRFNAVAATATGGNWLQISPSGVACCYTAESVIVTVNPSVTLAAGTYTGEITFIEYSTNDISMTVPVTLVVAPANTPFFDDIPGQITFSMKTGGTMPYQTLQIRNGGSGTLAWSLSKSTSDGGNWLSVSATSGTAPSPLAIAVVPSALPNGGLIAGIYTGQVILRAASSSVTIPISVTVGDDIFQQSNPLSFTTPAGGGNPLPQILTVAGPGATIRFNATAATGKGGNWLQISPSGAPCCYTPESITVSVNAAGLAAGTYTGELLFIEYGANYPAMTVPVTLTVAPAAGPYFAAVQGQISFAMQPGGSGPASQAVQIQNGGSGALSWTLAKSTSDNGNWLSVSATSGTAPSTVQVGIVTSALPNSGLIAGLFTGELVFYSATGNISVPITVTVGDTFSPLNPIAFSMPVGGPNPLAQAFSVASSGAGIRFSATTATAEGGNWLQISPQGVACCNTPQLITATVNALTLASGTYIGELNFVEYGSNDRSITVPVTLVVGSGLATITDANGDRPIQ